jgi:hypothetical protein
MRENAFWEYHEDWVDDSKRNRFQHDTKSPKFVLNDAHGIVINFVFKELSNLVGISHIVEILFCCSRVTFIPIYFNHCDDLYHFNNIQLQHIDFNPQQMTHVETLFPICSSHISYQSSWIYFRQTHEKSECVTSKGCWRKEIIMWMKKKWIWVKNWAGIEI